MVQEIYYSFPVKEHLQLDSDFFKMTILGLKETDFDSYLNHIALSAMRSKKKISFWKIMDHFEVLSKNYQAPKIVPVGAYVRNEMLKKRA